MMLRDRPLADRYCILEAKAVDLTATLGGFGVVLAPADDVDAPKAAAGAVRCDVRLAGATFVPTSARS